MFNSLILAANLHLFEGGEGAGGAEGGTTATPAPTRQGKQTGEQVRYGKQPAQQTPVAAEPQQEGGIKTTSNTLEERRKAYRELVSGEYKDLYTEDTQRMIDRRFKETKSLQDQINGMKPIMDMLAQRYKVQDGDPTKILQAVEADDAYWSEAAEEAGMDVNAFKQMQKMQRENAALNEMLRQRQQNEAAQQFLQKVTDEAVELQKVYPSFDLQAELENPQFKNMIKAGVPMQHAFEVLHMDAVKAGIAAATSQATERQLAEKVRQQGARPSENGASPQSAFTVKDDVSKLTKKDRARIAELVARGEHISF